MATHSSVLAWRIPGTGEPGGLPSMGLHRVRHNWSDLVSARYTAPGKGNGNPLWYSCLENSMDTGAWWATAHRVAKSCTRLNGEHTHTKYTTVVHTWPKVEYVYLYIYIYIYIYIFHTFQGLSCWKIITALLWKSLTLLSRVVSSLVSVHIWFNHLWAHAPSFTFPQLVIAQPITLIHWQESKMMHPFRRLFGNFYGSSKHTLTQSWPSKVPATYSLKRNWNIYPHKAEHLQQLC